MSEAVVAEEWEPLGQMEAQAQVAMAELV